MNADGTPLCYIGLEYVRSELVMEHAKAKVVKHFRKVYADRTLEAETGDTEIRKPEIPPRFCVTATPQPPL